MTPTFNEGGFCLTFWRFVVCAQIKWSLPCRYFVNNNAKRIDITLRCTLMCSVVQSQQFWSRPEHLYRMVKINSNSSPVHTDRLLLQYAKLSAFSDSSSADELLILCNPKSVIFSTNLESTTQLDDFRLPCDLMSVVCKKCIP